jgi:RNA polymerase sigma-70 factor, ECF subfamily
MNAHISKSPNNDLFRRACCTATALTHDTPTLERRNHLVSLLVLTSRGDRHSFEGLYRLTAPNLYMQLTRILKRESWADEVLQEVFVKIWIHAGDYQTKVSSPMTWMSSIARNAALDRLDQRDCHEQELSTEFAEAIVDPDAGPMQICARNTDADRVNQCLGKLPAPLRQAISLAFYQGLTHREIATVLEQPLGTIKTRIRRALGMLKEGIEQ